ncbi:hypothetical protein BR93DRAFT_925865 [Coniochaeta sp. PMI_546]|nr:hypothetical protein BR93DRAFT_925865 [Coniochaeta sp. PMI_546]
MYDRQGGLALSPINHTESLEKIRPHHRSFPAPRGAYIRSLTQSSDTGRYYSFPSFDIYEASQQDEEKESEKSP